MLGLWLLLQTLFRCLLGEGYGEGGRRKWEMVLRFIVVHRKDTGGKVGCRGLPNGRVSSRWEDAEAAAGGTEGGENVVGRWGSECGGAWVLRVPYW